MTTKSEPSSAEPVEPHTVFREQIITDRTGDLLRETSAFTAEYQRPSALMLQEPDTSLSVPVLLAAGNNAPIGIPASIFDPYRANPKRRTGTARMTSLDSFIAHVNRFKDPDSAIFANDDRAKPALTAVLNYHEALNTSSDAGFDDVQPAAAPRFGDHRTHYAFELSDEWRAWSEKSGEMIGMIEFAEFLEERIVDVVSLGIDDMSASIRDLMAATQLTSIATPSKLLELSRGLQVNESSVVKQATNLSSGEGQIMFETTHTDAAGKPVDVPGLFVICIPVFKSDSPYQIAARLKYRKIGGQLKFSFELRQLERTFDDAMQIACDVVANLTGLPLFHGSPE